MNGEHKIWRHLLFWLVYFAINLFNELYLSSSFTAHPSTELLLDSVLAQLLVLVIKIPAVYYVLYSFIPRWLRSGAKFRLATEAIVVFFCLLLCYRGMVQYVLWPYVYREEHTGFTGLQLAARLFYSLMDLLQVTGIAAAIRLFRLRISAMKNEKNLVREKLRSEMLHLRAQVNPHFLFNTLNSIYALSRSGSDMTPDAVMRLSKIMRYILYECQKKTITLDEELKIITDYIALQQIRFGKKVNVDTKTNIDNKDAHVTPLLILPLVENAFKHGTAGINEAGEIQLQITLQDSVLHVHLQNTTAPLSIPPQDREGIGMVNLGRRLELLYRDYDLSYGKTGNNFITELKINLDSYAGFELLDSRG